MDLCERYSKLSNLSQLEILDGSKDIDKKQSIIAEFLSKHHQAESSRSEELKHLKLLRAVSWKDLECLSLEGPNGCCLFTRKLNRFDHFEKIMLEFQNAAEDKEKLYLLQDIAVLQTTRWIRAMELNGWLVEFLEGQKSRELQDIEMEMYGYFADSYALGATVLKSSVADEMKKQMDSIMERIHSLINQENFKLSSLARLLPKLVGVYGANETLRTFWSDRIWNMSNLGEALAICCVMMDVSLAGTKKDFDFWLGTCGKGFFDDAFWRLIMRGLGSIVRQERKLALHLFKRAIDFMDENVAIVQKKLKLYGKSEIVVPFMPFNCSIEESGVAITRTNFFLILEAVEEKQKHLVLPTLERLTHLLDEFSKKTHRAYSFSVDWLRCTFQRILQHGNIAVEKFALDKLLNFADLDVFEDDCFMSFLSESLNKLMLYGYDEATEKRPKIVSQLETFFRRCEKAERNIMRSFLSSISKISWCPVAIFWVLKAIVGAAEGTLEFRKNWNSEDFRSIKNLVEKSLTTHSITLRENSQRLVLRAFCAYAQEIPITDDLELILNVICSTSEYLLSEWRSTGSAVSEKLVTMISGPEAVAYVEKGIRNILDKSDVRSFAVTMAFLVESSLIFCDSNCPAGKAFNELIANIKDVDSRPYTDLDYFDKATQLLDQFFLIPCIEYNVFCCRTHDLYLETIFNVAKNQVMKKNFSWINNQLIVTVFNFRSRCWLETHPTKLRILHQTYEKILLNPRELHMDMRCSFYALKLVTSLDNIYKYILGYESSCKAFLPIIYEYLREEILNSSARNNDKDGFSSNDPSGPNFSLEYCRVFLACLNQHATGDNTVLDCLGNQLYEGLLQFVEMADQQIVSLVAEIILRAVIEGTNQEKNALIIISIVRSSWRFMLQSNKSKIYVDAMCCLIGLTFNPQFLQLPGATNLAVECIEPLMSEWDKVPLIKHAFAKLAMNFSVECRPFQKPFLSCLLHGPILRCDQRIEAATLSHCQDVPFDAQGVDQRIRAASAVTLTKNAHFRRGTIKDIVEIFEKNRNKRYFDNSNLHRLKHRAMQALLTMSDHLTSEECIYLHDAMRDSLMMESNQPSVRLMQEWILVRIYAKEPTLRDSMWKLFHTAIEKRPRSIVSVANIIYHYSKSLHDNEQYAFIVKAIPHLLPNCMSQQFNVRLSSQTILAKMYEMLPVDSCEARQQKVIYDGVKESLSCGKTMKNPNQAFDDFYLTHFNAWDDYNPLMIYYTLPRLTGLSSDEWIPIDVISEEPWNEDFFTYSHYVINEKWNTVDPLVNGSRSTGDFDVESNSTDDGSMDVQKKIIPWKSIIPLKDDLWEMGENGESMKKMEHEDSRGIIVVASLIEKSPNLGGLARTCEIFGAKELVIGSLKYTENSEFQSLSVSAEKWIKITEVKPHLLQIYLLEMRDKGWKLVGAEQTANSRDLRDMEFDEKTVLLLGNEKSGIPANLIGILDTCVEIPQCGVVRSLNVHVTGAICIWQYGQKHSLRVD